MDVKSKMDKIAKWIDGITKAKANIIKEFCGGMDNEEIAKYFLYPNMKEKHKDFCRLYAQSKICHSSIKAENLCCYGCNCPNYDVEYYKYSNDDKNLIMGRCRIGSKGGKYLKIPDRGETKGYRIWDCSGCVIPHSVEYIKDYITKN